MLVRVLFIIIICSTVIISTLGQIVRPGKCPNYEKMQQVKNFKHERFGGPWYEYERFAEDEDVVHQSCNAVFYQAEDGGNLFAVEQYQNTLTHEAETVLWQKKTDSIEGSIQGHYNIFNTVLETDYRNFAIVYYCVKNPGNTHIEFLRVLTRKRAPLEKTVTNAHKRIDSHKIPRSHLFKINHKDCL